MSRTKQTHTRYKIIKEIIREDRAIDNSASVLQHIHPSPATCTSFSILLI